MRLPWVGRAFDLKAAYKQFGVSEEDTKRLKVALKAGPDAVRFSDVLALPSGATGSVVAFLRVAASLAFIGTDGLHICWSSFFDDFTAVSPMSLSDNAQFYVVALFRLLGIDFASEGDKAPPFNQVFKSLGLQFDLNKVDEGHFTLRHTYSRRRELLEQIETMIEGRDTLVSAIELEWLHGRPVGRPVWFNAFVFGRTLKAAVCVISKFSRSSSNMVKVHGTLRDALVVLRAGLAKDEPVLVAEAISKTWMVFTDGAYEPDGKVKASIGGVLVNETGLVIECFGLEIEDSLREEFLAKSQHPIYELEIFPVLVALRTWKKQLSNSQVVFYLDHDAARSALIRADGSTELSQVILAEFVKLEKDTGILPWFARVPSASNPADDASRLVCNTPWLLGVPSPPLSFQLGCHSGVCRRSCKQDAVWNLTKENFGLGWKHDTDQADRNPFAYTSRIACPIQNFPQLT